MAWKKGQSGNPAGRPSGAKDRFTNKVWADWANDWEIGGPDAIAKVRKDDPSTYVRVAASLMPKEMEATIRTIAANELSDDELASIAAGSGDDAADAPLDPPVTH